MKILVISNIFPPGFIGGYELGAFDIAKGLHQCGYQVEVLTSDYFLDDHEELKFLNVARSLSCPAISHDITPQDQIKQKYYNFQNIRTLGSTIRRFNPDVVLAFNLHGLGAISIIQYLQKISIPTILYLMDNIFFGLDVQSPLHQHYEKLFGPLQLNHFTHVIAMSENLVREINHKLNLPLEPVTYIPGWVDFQPYSISRPIPNKSGMIRFVFCSRIEPDKGTDIMLDAVELLAQQGFSQFTIDVYSGSGQIAVFLQKIKAKNLEKYVLFKGKLKKSAMLPTLSKYDALLFPTWEREAFGFVVSEAAVSGCFPIMTSGIGASEWFLDGYDCFKISRNAASLAAAMQQVMRWSDEEKANKRYNTLISSRKNFEFNRWFSSIQKICLDMAATKKSQDYYRATKGVESAFLFLSHLIT